MSNLVDSGARTTFETGAQREVVPGKGRYDLLPQHPIDRLAKHFENGAVKYAARNWEKGIPLHSFLDSADRHMHKLMVGMMDEDHAAAVLWNVACFMQTWQWIVEGKLPISLADELQPELRKQLEHQQMERLLAITNEQKSNTESPSK